MLRTESGRRGSKLRCPVLARCVIVIVAPHDTINTKRSDSFRSVPLTEIEADLVADLANIISWDINFHFYQQMDFATDNLPVEWAKR